MLRATDWNRINHPFMQNGGSNPFRAYVNNDRNQIVLAAEHVFMMTNLCSTITFSTFVLDFFLHFFLHRYVLQQNTKPFFKDRRYCAGRAKTTVILWVSQLALVIITLLFLWCQLCQKLWPWKIKTLYTRRVFIGSSCQIKNVLSLGKILFQMSCVFLSFAYLEKDFLFLGG